MRASIKLGLMLILALTTIIAGHAKPGLTEDAAAFYKGKVITWVVPFTPGGIYDTYGRYAAPTLKKYTGATVVVNNMPGAGGLKAVNYVHNVAKRDGLTLLIAPGTAVPLNKVMKVREAKYELETFNWIARIRPEIDAVFVGAKSAYRSVNDLRAAKQIKFGAAGVWSYTGIGAAMAAEGLGLTNAKIVAGYRGGTQIEMAVLKGEVDIATKTAGSVKDLIEAGEAIPIVQLAKKRAPFLPNTPTIYEVGISGKTKEWMDWWTTMTSMGRILLTTPGVPEARLEFLRDAVKKTLYDKEFAARCDRDKRDMAVGYLTGPELYKQTQKLTALSEEQVKEFRYLVGKKYYK